MGGCPNYGPFLGTLNIRCRIIIGIQKGAIILTTTHIGFSRKFCDGTCWEYNWLDHESKGTHFRGA